ncbi:sigma-70 family RNA polymerase sigma factor [Pelagicoccus sp. SDUM812003]|uniref:RNA polymerase sigma factor n=1 Tax=Pelagicoccus sp. SDUM812003 TaxID=3041267 RepID=UPI0028106ED0|nr:sigma-70 family RNA polymerase sigma factor [Pelagicoccus sp. SDUM812003]MDQ8204541.1 sigma-70 family RNA polymerase sigma factor [Pelagicoccus sp. SDUM812003]
MSERDVTDRDLMQALVAGNQRALDRIIERWERPLYSFAFRYLQNEALTRDIVQETFVRVYTKRERYNPDFPLSSWIFTIAANLCKNRARWRMRHPEVSLETPIGGEDGKDALRMEDVVATEQPQPGERLQADEELRALKRVVASLPHDLRTAVLLHHYENVSYKEIADIVGCSVRGVETRLYRARKLLRVRMKQVLGSEDAAEKKTTFPASSFSLSELGHLADG